MFVISIYVPRMFVMFIVTCNFYDIIVPSCFIRLYDKYYPFPLFFPDFAPSLS
jgi:hypothetical protein